MKKVIEMTVRVTFRLDARQFAERGSRTAEEQLVYAIGRTPGLSGARLEAPGEAVGEAPDGPHDHLVGGEPCDRCGHTRENAPDGCCEMCAAIKARGVGHA